MGRGVQEIIELCGYADQSHFVNDIARHTNRPASKLASPGATAAHRFFNASDLSAFCPTTYL